MQIGASALSGASWFKSLEKTGATSFPSLTAGERDLKAERQDNSAEGVAPTTLAGLNLPTSLLSLDSIFTLQASGPDSDAIIGAANEPPVEPVDYAPTSLSDDSSADSIDKPSAEDEFMKYMEMTPEERIRDAILKKLGLTEEDLEKMTPEERKGVEQKITDMIKESVTPGNEDDRARTTNDAAARLQAQQYAQTYAAASVRAQSLG